MSGSGHKHKKEKKKKSKKSSKSKKHKKEKKKRKSKKRKHSSSSDSESESNDDQRKRKRDDNDSDTDSDSDSDNSEDQWIEKGAEQVKKTNEASSVREDWLGGLSSITTFSREPKPDTQKKAANNTANSYDPAKSVRELNPYWKDGGGGLPKTFSKPKNDSDDDNDSYRIQQNDKERRSNWRKKNETCISTNAAPSTSKQRRRSGERELSQRKPRSSSSSSSSDRDSVKSDQKSPQPQESVQREHFLTDHQMNELGAKLVKAELLGNEELVNELKGKLEKAREYRKTQKAEVMSKSYERRSDNRKHHDKEKEDILLTATNSKGFSRPVAQSHKNDDPWGGRSGRKTKKSKPAETHMDGERVRFFADDDKYDIKQMVRPIQFHTFICGKPI